VLFFSLDGVVLNPLQYRVDGCEQSVRNGCTQRQRPNPPPPPVRRSSSLRGQSRLLFAATVNGVKHSKSLAPLLKSFLLLETYCLYSDKNHRKSIRAVRITSLPNLILMQYGHIACNKWID